MKGAEEDLNMGFQPFKAFLLLFRLAVTDTDQCDDRRHIQQRQRIGIFVLDLTGGDQAAEDTGMVGDNTLHIALGVQRRQLR